MQKITDPPLTRCPTCAGRVNKLISSTSFQLKGSGWYATDYGRKDSDKTKGKETSSEAKSESKSEAPAPADKAKPGSSTQAAAA